MDRILIILKKENGPRASSAPALGLNTIIFKHVYWYMQQTQVSVYRTIGPLVMSLYLLKLWMDQVDTLHVGRYWSEVLCCTIMTHLGDLEVKVTDLEIFG